MENDSSTPGIILQYQKLLEMGEIITSEMNLDSLFSVIADQINRVLNTDSHDIAIALGNACLYEQMHLMLKAREWVIYRLSHELKTPLAVISGALESIRRKIGVGCASGLDKTISRGLRHLP